MTWRALSISPYREDHRADRRSRRTRRTPCRRRAGAGIRSHRIRSRRAGGRGGAAAGRAGAGTRSRRIRRRLAAGGVRRGPVRDRGGRASREAGRTGLGDRVSGPGRYCSPRYRMPYNSRNEGLADIIRQIIGCNMTSTNGPGRYCPPRQRMPHNSRNEGSKHVSTTWQQISARPHHVCRTQVGTRSHHPPPRLPLRIIGPRRYRPPRHRHAC